MTAKEFFGSVRRAERELYLIRQRQEHAMDMATRLSGAGSETHIRTPGNRFPVETAAINLADLGNTMDADLQKYTALVRKAQDVIRQIPQARFREVLTLRYLCGHTWRTISDEMDYADGKSVFRVHGWALQAADAVLKIFPGNTT